MCFYVYVNVKLCREEKAEEPEQPKYRDRAKERREEQNPDYDIPEFGSFHAVAPPGTVDMRWVLWVVSSPVYSVTVCLFLCDPVFWF